jgi:hypothetical protein
VDKKINGTELSKADLEHVMKNVANHVAQVLAVFYPDTARVNGKKLVEVAQAAAIDISQYGRLQELIQNPDSTQKIRIQIDRVGLINPVPERVVEFASPARLERCQNIQETLSTLQMIALISDPTLRAFLYLQGFRIKWSVYDTKSKIVAPKTTA